MEAANKEREVVDKEQGRGEKTLLQVEAQVLHKKDSSHSKRREGKNNVANPGSLVVQKEKMRELLPAGSYGLDKI